MNIDELSLVLHLSSQGSVVSAIGSGISAVVFAIASVIETIIMAIVGVRIADIKMKRTSASY
jgi:hypothetical protein